MGRVILLGSFLTNDKDTNTFNCFRKRFAKMLTVLVLVEISKNEIVTFSSFKFCTAHIGFTFVDCC